MTGELSAYATIGAKLIERGYCALPAAPGTKVPGVLSLGHWQPMRDWASRYSARLPTAREIDGWERAGSAGVCLIAGRASQGVVAIDADTEEAAAAMRRALPYTPARKKGQKGETSFYRGGPGLKSKSFNKPLGEGRQLRLLDVIAEGRQTVLPPTIHPDTGKPYYWSGETALPDLNPDELPELPDDVLELIAEALRPLGYDAAKDRPELKRAASNDDEKSPHRNLNDHALANLDAWIPKLPLCRLRKTSQGWEAVADWRSSNTGKPLAKRKLNLKMVKEGIKDFGMDRGYSPLDLLIACGRAPDVDRAFGLLADMTGWGSGQIVLDLPEDRQRAPVAAKEPVLPAVVAPEPPARPVAPWKRQEDATKCPGLVGEIADFILATGDYQQPLMAIGAALAMVGTCAGRQLATPTFSGTQLYIIGVAGTGTGKDHPLKSITRIMFAAKLQHLLGAGEFTSATSMVNTVIRSPACVCAMDEFGAFLARGKNRTASSHEQGISSFMRKLWSSSFDQVPTTERAGAKFDFVHSPALSIFGTSTPDELYAALGDADVRNGLLNRFLILANHTRPPRAEAVMDKGDIPPTIIDGLYNVYHRLSEMGGAPYHAGGTTPCPPPQMVHWHDEFAHLDFDEFAEAMQRRMDADPENERFLVRTAEMAVRIATIRAVGIDARDPRVTKEDMAWGKNIALISAQAMIEGARDNMAENDRQRWSNQMVNVVKRMGTATPRDLQQALKGKVKGAEFKDIIANLVEAGRIELVDLADERTDTRKRPGYRYLG